LLNDKVPEDKIIVYFLVDSLWSQRFDYTRQRFTQTQHVSGTLHLIAVHLQYSSAERDTRGLTITNRAILFWLVGKKLS